MEFQQTNILSMTGNNDFATEDQLAAYVTLATAQSISGIKTFTALPISSVVPTTSTQLVNKNYVDGAFVTLSTTQTISGLKTFSANVRLNNTRQLIFGTTTGAVLNFTGAGMYYDNQAGGSHFFFVNGIPIVDIDSTGLIIRTSMKLWFYNGSWIYEDGGGSHLDYNTPTGYYHSFRINNVEQLRINATTATFIKDIKMKLGSYFFVDDAFVSGTLTGDNNGGIRFDSGVGAGFSFYSNSAPVLTIEPTKVIQPSDTVWQFGITGASIGYVTASTSLNYNVPISKTHKFFINSVSQLVLDASLGATFSGNVNSSGNVNLKAGGRFIPDDLYFGGAISAYGSGGLRFDSDTGGPGFRFVDDSTLALDINFAGIAIPTNNTLQFGVAGSNIVYFAGTTLRYNLPTGKTHAFRINATNILEVLATGISVVGGYLGRAGTGGVFAATYNNAYYTGAVLQAWNNATNLGNFTICDYRIKENIKPARNVLDRLCQVEMIEYEQKDISIFKKVGNHMGFIAHQVKELFQELPNIVSGEKDALNSEGDIQPQTINSEFTNLYLKAIQELNAKVEEQNKRIEDQQKMINDLFLIINELKKND